MRLLKGWWQSTVPEIRRMRGAWSVESEDVRELNNPAGNSLAKEQRQFVLSAPAAQKRLPIPCPHGYRSCFDQHVNAEPGRRPASGSNECCAMTTTRATPVIVAHAKVTEGPKVKRKLGSNKWDLVHDAIQAEKRDATSCPSDYQLCPESLKGGCCPSDRVCGMSSCYLTSAGPASACGLSGYVACGIAEGGGCCPASYSCAVGGCRPFPGVQHSETCGFDSYLCPSSLNYGCCKSGMACGLKNCYATSITTVTLIETFTTTDANSRVRTVTSTSITAQTPAIPSVTAAPSSMLGVVPKIGLQATTIPKMVAGSSPSSGLSTAAIGGIIGGAVAVLIVIICATCLIVRRLNKAIKVGTTSKSRTTSSRARSGPQNPRPSLGQDVDLLSIDPLNMAASSVAPSIRHPSYTSATSTPIHEVEGTSPPQLYSPYSPRSPRSPSSTYQPGGYRAVGSHESHHSASSHTHRNHSFDSTPPLPGITPTGYFDLPHAGPDLRDQNLRFGRDSHPSRRPSRHARNWSDASDASQLSADSSDLIELDAGLDGDRRSGFQKALQGLGMGRIVSRRRSDPVTSHAAASSSSPPPRNDEWTGRRQDGARGLQYIPEMGESHGQAERPGTRHD